MGKKPSGASLKISKNQNQQFSSLIKVLRPRVYITDTSTFKKLVQELTGNNGSSKAKPEVDHENNYLLEGSEVQTDHLGETETSFEGSPTSSEATSSSSEFCCNQTYLDDDTILGGSEADQYLDHLLPCQNLEALLLDVEVEPSPLYDCYAQTEQEVSIYDYELWEGLL